MKAVLRFMLFVFGKTAKSRLAAVEIIKIYQFQPVFIMVFGKENDLWRLQRYFAENLKKID